MKKLNRISYIVVLVLLTIVLSLLVADKVSSKTQADILFDNHYYEQAEREYKVQVANVLAEYKCFYSGINLTREVNLDGQRSYQVYIHDQQFEYLEDTAFEALSEKISAIRIIADEEHTYQASVVFSKNQ